MSVPRHGMDGPADGDRRALSSALADALTACRDAMTHSATGALDRELVQSRIRRACVLARKDGVPVEVLLVQLKRALRETSSVQRWTEPSKDDYQHSVIQFLVHTYYSDSR